MLDLDGPVFAVKGHHLEDQALGTLVPVTYDRREFAHLLGPRVAEPGHAQNSTSGFRVQHGHGNDARVFDMEQGECPLSDSWQ